RGHDALPLFLPLAFVEETLGVLVGHAAPREARKRHRELGLPDLQGALLRGLPQAGEQRDERLQELEAQAELADLEPREEALALAEPGLGELHQKLEAGQHLSGLAELAGRALRLVELRSGAAALARPATHLAVDPGYCVAVGEGHAVAEGKARQPGHPQQEG